MGSNYSISLLFGLCLLFLVSCSWDAIVIPTFSEKELSLVPYSGNESLTFSDSSGKTFTLAGAGRTDRLIDLDTMADDVDWKRSAYTRLNTTFFIGDGQPNPGYVALQKNSKDGKTTFERMYILFYSPVDSNGNFGAGVFTLQLDHEQLKFGNRDESHEWSTGELLPSFSVGGETYSNVYKIFDYNYDPDYEYAKPAGKILYYSITDGIVAVEFTDNSFWYLVP